METFLPWLGVFVPVLLVLGGACGRSATALIAVVLPVVVWLNLFGGLLVDRTGAGGDLTVATHNVNAENPDPPGTARDVAASGADVVALEELTRHGRPRVREGAGVDVPVPLGAGHGRAVEQVPAERRASRSTSSSAGRARCGRRSRRRTAQVAVYVAHLPSVRVKLQAGFTARQRDESADALGEAIADEQLHEGRSCSATSTAR